MSTCRFRERLAAHAAEPDEDVAAHLPGCAACRAELAEAEAVLAGLRRERAAEPDEAFLADLGERVRAALVTPPPRRWVWALAPGLVAAAAAVWLWAGSRLGEGPHRPEPAIAVVPEPPLPSHAGAPGSLADPDPAGLADELDEPGVDLALAAFSLPGLDDVAPAADLADPDAADLVESLDDSQLDAASAAL